MKNNIYIPCDVLKPFISSFIVSEMDEASVYRVLPDTGVVIGFQYRGRLSIVRNDGEAGLAVSGVSGLSDRSRVFKNTPGIGTVLVCFKEAGAAQFFRQPVHELFRESVSLDNFMLRSELLTLEDRLCATKTDAQRIEIVERFLIGRMTHAQPDKLVLAALALIHKSKGSIRITELMEQLHTSQSPLEKRFRQAVGTTPKSSLLSCGLSMLSGSTNRRAL